MLNMHFRKALLSLGALCLTIIPANAENLLTTRFAKKQNFTEPGFLILLDTGSFTQGFFTDEKQTVMISFSAVCSTSGTGKEATSIQIILDNKTVYPALGDDVFCSAANTSSAKDGLATHTVITGVEVGSGNHDIRVQVVPRNGGTSRIDNLSLLVWN